MMSSPFLSNGNNINCSCPNALVFQYDSPMFFTVERSTNKHFNNKRKHSVFAVEQQSEDLAASVSKRARSVPVRCKRTYSDLNKKYKSYRNEEEEVAEEEPAVHSPSKRRRTTLLSKGRVFVYTPSSMKNAHPSPATIFCNNQEEGVIESLIRCMKNLSLAQSQEEKEIESLTLRMQNLSLAQSQEEKEIDSLTQSMQNLSLTQSQEEEIKLITCRLSMLSLTQSQEEVEKEDEHKMDWSYDSSMDWSYDFEY